MVTLYEVHTDWSSRVQSLGTTEGPTEWSVLPNRYLNVALVWGSSHGIGCTQLDEVIMRIEWLNCLSKILELCTLHKLVGEDTRMENVLSLRTFCHPIA